MHNYYWAIIRTHFVNVITSLCTSSNMGKGIFLKYWRAGGKIPYKLKINTMFEAQVVNKNLF